MYCILSIYHNDDFWNSEIDAINTYINFWKEIAYEFKNYDDYLIFESNHKLYYINITLLNVSQSFIDVIRNSGGLNTKRLLIIPKLSTEIEIYYTSDQLPNDPSNKTAISLRYYFPSIYGGEHIYDDDGNHYFIIDEDDIVWYDYSGEMLVTTPFRDWGIESYHYYFIYQDFQNLQNMFNNKGIPVIIGEAGILINKGNPNILSEFLYVLFSMSYEYDGIMACLWDNQENNEGDRIYYNRETNKWTNEKIKKSIQKISRGNFIRTLDYYINTNVEIIIPEENHWNSDIEIKQTKILTLYINARLYGKLGEDIEFGFCYFNNDYELTYFKIKKQHSKKQYDGTTIFKIDLENIDINQILQGEIYKGNNLIFINNVTLVFKGYFYMFDYHNLQKEVLNELNK